MGSQYGERGGYSRITFSLQKYLKCVNSQFLYNLSKSLIWNRNSPECDIRENFNTNKYPNIFICPMSKYICRNKFDTNKCLNIFVTKIDSNKCLNKYLKMRIYSSHSETASTHKLPKVPQLFSIHQIGV